MGESKGKSQDCVETWEGGFIRTDVKGRKVYVIRRMINGKSYKVSTRAGNARAPMEQLKRFEADPEGYNPAGAPREAPIYLDAPLAEEFLIWNRDVKKNSREWLEKQQRYLAWWADQLKGLDLRKVSLVDHIKPALKGAGNGPHRIAVLKSVYSWLRKEKHLLTVNEDPTFQTLVVPQARPEQWKRVKVIPRENYLLAREHLAPHWRDGMDVQAGTGWHVTELIRFAKEGSVEPYRGDAEGVSGVLVCPQTKNGEPLRTAVSAEVLKPGSGYWSGAPSGARSTAWQLSRPARQRAYRRSLPADSDIPLPPGPSRGARIRPRSRPSSTIRARAPRGASMRLMQSLQRSPPSADA